MSLEIFYKGALLGHIEPDPVQNSFPWYQGTFVPTTVFEAYRQFFAWYEDVSSFDQP